MLVPKLLLIKIVGVQLAVSKQLIFKEKPDVTNPKVTGYCDLQFTCRQNYDAANKVFDRNLFVTLVVLGALSVLIANFFKGNAVISAGLSFGGVLSFVIASMRYWSNANDILKVGILGVALVLLFWIATKKFKD